MEYILIVVVVIALATALANAFFKPWNEWARNYIGDYIYCLLDQGELPALGGEDAVSDCEKGFESFTAAAGRPPKKDSGSEEDSGGEKGGRERLNQTSGDKNYSAGGGGRSGSPRTAGLGTGFDNGESVRGSKVTDVTSTFSRRAGARFSSGSRLGGPAGRRSEYNGITGAMRFEEERIRKREEKVRSVARASDVAGSFVRGGNKSIPLELASKKPQELDLTTGWSFGEGFRILLIVIIIIALLLFVGSQVMQISKSMEKE